jgi:hypothetical protein
VKKKCVEKYSYSLWVGSSWNVMAHGDVLEEKWRGNKRMEWVTSKRHMTAEHRLARAVQTLQSDVNSSPANSRLNWRPCHFKWTRPSRRKTKSGFCACVTTFQTQSTIRNTKIYGVSQVKLLRVRNRGNWSYRYAWKLYSVTCSDF